MWMVKHAWQGDVHRQTINLHSKYGELVRTGPNETSVTDVEAIKKIYGSVATRCPSPRRGGGRTRSEFLLGPGAKFRGSDWYIVFQDYHKFAGRDEGVHASQRRLVSYIYAIDSFKDLEKYVQDAVSHFMSKLHELQGSKIGLGLRLQLFAFGKYFSSACTTHENWLRCDRRGHLLQTLWVHGRSKR